MAQDIQQIPKEHYYDNQLLTVEDFEREQAYHSAHRELHTRLCYTAGVLSGLTVGQGSAPGEIQISPGVAIDGMGRQIVLAAGARFGGAVVNAASGEFVLDLNDSAWYDIARVKVWQLTIEADSTPLAQDGQWIEYPKLSLSLPGTGSSQSLIVLAEVTIKATETTDSSSGKPVQKVAVAVGTDSRFQLAAALSPERVPAVNADKITGKLNPLSIPDLNASQITAGKLNPALIPDLDAELIKTGKLDAAVIPALTAADIPNLDAAKIATGKLAANVIPDLDAAKIASGKFSEVLIPEIPASRISSGKLSLNLIPELDASLITSGVLSADRLPPDAGGAGSLGGLQAVWAIDVAVFARGLKAEAVGTAASKSGFAMGLLSTRASAGATYYALAIGFESRLVSFTSAQLQAAGVKLNVYPERTAYDLAREGGAPDQTATLVRFLGLDPAYSFNLLLPETQLPAASQGKIRSLVTIGTAIADNSDSSKIPIGAASILSTIRDAVSPFSFLALTAAAVPAVLSPDELALQLGAAGAIAAEAAPQMVARQPAAFSGTSGAARLAALLREHFKESTDDPAQMAWALASSGVGPADATKALVAAYQLDPKTAQSATAGAYPPPSVQRLIIQLQGSGIAALDAALQLKTAMKAAQPLQVGVALRLNFAGSADTPIQIAQCMKNAKYTAADAVRTALTLLFPKASAQELAAAMKEFAGK
jgi:hypothetical protein